MSDVTRDLNRALDEVSASSAGGSPFLLAYGLTFLLTAVFSFFLSLETAALVAMFQGGVALPLAFWLERRMGTQRMSPDNPLRSLSAQMAVSQALGLPAMIAVYTLDPSLIPLVLASLGGVHFLPYAWLHRSRIYAILAVAVSIGAFVIQVLLPSGEFAAILFYVALIYWAAAVPVYRHARRLVSQST